MRYQVSDIPEGHAKKHNHSFSEPPENFGLTVNEINVEGNITGRFTLWREGSIVTIQGDIFANATMECCRCLETVSTSLRPVVTLRCIPGASTTGDVRESGEMSPEDDLYTYDGIVLDIRPIIREQMLLIVPAYSYCRLDCQGLCAVCGQDLNHTQCRCSVTQPDARFAALQRLKWTSG